MNGTNKINENAVLVSIIVATYNSAEHIRGCLESIKALAIDDLEVVIVDGGSTDDTLAIIRQFAGLSLRWVSESDKGIYDALNKGAKMARGKWLNFLGSDDRLLPGFKELYENLTDENTLYYGYSEPWYHGNTKPPYILLGGPFTKYRLAKYCVNHQALIYPAKVFRKYSYDLRYKIFADYALNIKVWGDKDFKTKYYPVPVALYNMNGISSLMQDHLFKAEKAGLIKEHLGWLIYLRFLWKKNKKRLEGEPDW